MAKRIIWVVELMVWGKWFAFHCLSIKLNRAEGRRFLKEWQIANPDDKFRLVKYVPQDRVQKEKGEARMEDLEKENDQHFRDIEATYTFQKKQRERIEELKKRLEEKEDRIYKFERANAMFEHEFKNIRNYALEEVLSICDKYENSRDFDGLTGEIRKLKRGNLTQPWLA